MLFWDEAICLEKYMHAFWIHWVLLFTSDQDHVIVVRPGTCLGKQEFPLTSHNVFNAQGVNGALELRDESLVLLKKPTILTLPRKVLQFVLLRNQVLHTDDWINSENTEVLPRTWCTIRWLHGWNLLLSRTLNYALDPISALIFHNLIWERFSHPIRNGKLPFLHPLKAFQQNGIVSQASLTSCSHWVTYAHWSL